MRRRGRFGSDVVIGVDRFACGRRHAARDEVLLVDDDGHRQVPGRVVVVVIRPSAMLVLLHVA